MSKLEQLKEIILSLTPEEFAAFCKWYDAFRAKEREEQMAADVQASKPDNLIREA